MLLHNQEGRAVMQVSRILRQHPARSSYTSDAIRARYSPKPAPAKPALSLVAILTCARRSDRQRRGPLLPFGVLHTLTYYFHHTHAVYGRYTVLA